MQITKVIADATKISHLINIVNAAAHPKIALEDVNRMVNDFLGHLVPYHEPQEQSQASTQPTEAPIK